MTTDNKDSEFPELIGLTLSEAYAVLRVRDLRLRVTCSDGVDGVVTADYRTDRVNVQVSGGRVCSVTGLG